MCRRKEGRRATSWTSTREKDPRVFQGQIINALKSTENSDRQKVNHLEIEAVMGSALENMTRYQAKLKRDLYRAIETLRKMQAERREGEN
jgi:hypothetical protein